MIEPASRRGFVPPGRGWPDGVIHDAWVRAEIADALHTFVNQLAVADVGAPVEQAG